MTVALQFTDMTSSKIFDVALLLLAIQLLVQVSCQYITGSRVLTIFFYKGLTRNLEIGNTPVRVLPSIWRLGRGRNTKFGTTVSNKLLNASKSQGYSFYCFWGTKEKSTWGKITSRRTQIRVKGFIWRNKNNIAETRITLEKPDPADKRVKDFCTYSCRQNFPNIAVQNFFFF